jgi:hypothetical protein
LLYKLADLMERDIDVLAELESLDNGKCVKIARAADLALSIAHLRYYAGWADKTHGQLVDVGPDFQAYTRHEPIGVCGQIIPWNFPLLMLAWKWGPVCLPDLVSFVSVRFCSAVFLSLFFSPILSCFPFLVFLLRSVVSQCRLWRVVTRL